MTFFPSPKASCPRRAKAERVQGGGLTGPRSLRQPESELKFSSQPPSCKAQCDLKLDIPLTMSVHFPHAASGLRGQVGTIRISTHVLLGWRQMTRLMPLAPLVRVAETPRSPAHLGGHGSSCRGRAAGKARGAQRPLPPAPARQGGPSGPSLSELISPHAYGCHRD